VLLRKTSTLPRRPGPILNYPLPAPLLNAPIAGPSVSRRCFVSNLRPLRRDAVSGARAPL